MSVPKSWNMKKNKIASGVEDTHDASWDWLIKYWSLLAHNPCTLEGLLIETTPLEGSL